MEPLNNYEEYRENFDYLWNDLDYKSKYLLLNNDEWRNLAESSFTLFSILILKNKNSDTQILDFFRYKKLDRNFIEFLLMSIPDTESVKYILNDAEENQEIVMAMVIKLVQFWWVSEYFNEIFPFHCEHIKDQVLESLHWIVQTENTSEYSLVSITIKQFVETIRESINNLFI
jgi:hypothetical protein